MGGVWASWATLADPLHSPRCLEGRKLIRVQLLNERCGMLTRCHPHGRRNTLTRKQKREICSDQEVEENTNLSMSASLVREEKGLFRKGGRRSTAFRSV